MRLKQILVGMSVAIFLTIGFTCESQHINTFAQSAQTTGTVSVAVGPQYDTTHVYVAPQDFDRFVASLIATFGGKTTKQGVFRVPPTTSSTMSQLVLTSVGTVSVVGLKTPIPYRFGVERRGYLVTDLDGAVSAAQSAGADVLVTPFNDPIGRDAVIQWPGGVAMQLYWHTTPPSYKPLASVPENRVYVSADRVAAFVQSFLAFSPRKAIAHHDPAPDTQIPHPTTPSPNLPIHPTFAH